LAGAIGRVSLSKKPSWLRAQGEATLNGSKMEQIHKYSQLKKNQNFD
jgi:hypothetical protein